MKALVTGAGGFLGRYVVEKLVARGDQVRGLARKAYPELHELGVEMIQGDIRDASIVEQATRGVEVVFHTAAVAGIWGPWQHFHGINTVGTQHVIAACRKNHVGRLVYTSSPSVTFNGSDQLNVNESAPYPTQWLCHYPHTKALAEQAVLAANEPGRLLTCALRPHLIWGPRDSHLIPRLIARARAGQLRRVGNGKNLVDTVYVENAADAHLLAADALDESSAQREAVGGQAYFISQGEPVNCWDWIDELLALADLPPVGRSISLRAAWRIGAICEGVYRVLRLRGEPRMTRFLAAQLGTSHYFDLTKARNELGYEPAISTSEGMQRLANAWSNR